MVSSKDELYLLKTVLKSIPEFDGFNISIDQFIDNCDHGFEIIDPKYERIFVKLLITKLKGQAYDAAQFENFLNYNNFKIFLYSMFRSPTTIVQIIGKLSNSYQNNSEKVITYAIRLESLKRQIYNIALCEDKLNDCFKNFIEKTLIDCFITGLKSEIYNKIKNNYTNFQKAWLEAIRIERENTIKNSIRNSPKFGLKINSNLLSHSPLNIVSKKNENYTSISKNSENTDILDKQTIADFTEPELVQSVKNNSFISTNPDQNKNSDIIISDILPFSIIKSKTYYCSPTLKINSNDTNALSSLIDIDHDSNKEVNKNSNYKLNDNFIQNKVDAFEHSDSHLNSDIEYSSNSTDNSRFLHFKLATEHNDIIFDNSFNSNSIFKHNNDLLKSSSDSILATQAFKYFKFPSNIKFTNDSISSNNILSIFNLKVKALNSKTSPYDFEKTITMHKHYYLFSNIVKAIYSYLFIVIYIIQNYLTHASNLTLNPVLNLMPKSRFTYTLIY